MRGFMFYRLEKKLEFNKKPNKKRAEYLLFFTDMTIIVYKM